jgi:hypothetical protein
MALPRAFEDAYSGDDMSIYVKRGGWSTSENWFWNILLAISVGFMVFGMLGCCDGVQAAATNPPAKTVDYNLTSATQVKFDGRTWGTVYTFEHDGHLFISQYNNFMMHHPNCPCQAKQVEIEAPE